LKAAPSAAVEGTFSMIYLFNSSIGMTKDAPAEAMSMFLPRVEKVFLQPQAELVNGAFLEQGEGRVTNP
jgi:hypothetical protein